jgi:hypothetical protein
MDAWLDMVARDAGRVRAGLHKQKLYGAFGRTHALMLNVCLYVLGGKHPIVMCSEISIPIVNSMQL